jgi:hypothetical protein
MTNNEGLVWYNLSHLALWIFHIHLVLLMVKSLKISLLCFFEFLFIFILKYKT